MLASAILDRRQLLRGGANLGALVITGPARAQAAPRRGGVLRISVDQAAAKLNPLLTRVNPEYLLAELLYSGLTRLGTDMTPEADLAASWAPPRTSPNGPSSYARTSSFTTARPALRPTSWRAS